MAVDAVTAEVTASFDEAGVPNILLKGPTVARWLYEEEHQRPYGDTDLLVDPAAIELARKTLHELGFRSHFRPRRHAGIEPPHADTWTRAPHVVDLHSALPGATGDRRSAWEVLYSEAPELKVGGRTVRGLARRALLVQLALHAAHHGTSMKHPVIDLRCALARCAPHEWSAAAMLAADISASEAFARGLSLLPEGRSVLGRIGMEPREWVGPSDPRGGPPLTEGFARVAAAPSARTRLAIIVDELFPTREFLWWWTPIARRSRRGLAMAYLWRPLYLMWQLARAVRARRRSHAGRDCAS